MALPALEVSYWGETMACLGHCRTFITRGVQGQARQASAKQDLGRAEAAPEEGAGLRAS